MSEDISLRFNLAAELMQMRFGSFRAIDVVTAHKAWPPTGDADRSIESAIRAMALARGGNRPEETYTSQERILNDLDDTFVVHLHPSGLDWIVARKTTACPICHGSGWRNVHEEIETPDVFSDFPQVIATEIIAYQRVPCDHPADWR